MKWPTWSQALLAATISGLVALALRRSRPARLGDRFGQVVGPAALEFAFVASLYAIWRMAKNLPLTQAEGAIERARDIVRVQEFFHLPSELTLQRFTLDHEWLAQFSAAFYAVAHVPGIVIFLVWLYARHRDVYPHWRNALAIVTAFCLFIRFVKVAPPRYLPDLGYVDVSEIYNMSVYGEAGTGVSSQFAAMPSLHVAWAAVVAFGALVGEHQQMALDRHGAPGDHDARGVGDRPPLVARRHRRVGAAVDRSAARHVRAPLGAHTARGTAPGVGRHRRRRGGRIGGRVTAHPNVIADLDRLGLTYEVMDCDPDLADTAQFCEAYGIAPEESANAILVASKKPEGHHAVCVVLAHTRLDVNGTVRRKLGVRKLSFAPAELTRELTGQEIGGVTIFGLPDGVPVWLDARILGCERIIVGAGSRSAKISLDPAQLVGVDGYEFVEDLAVEVPGDPA